ncbi:carbohydrate ABC transporter permease [Mediterraneibacter sp. NSJ-55]|uniref:Carbohydrate ABC transporter permease n=1 Tax=Mediterraneibacter hominis TaxID=2763054 RepID=A0A923RQX7_9FIRM|nr:carbohydrate ABC transporter permease [Mediterraneibacter hominis]MBC5689118.1 carbohydrate ABC transporter permease [Mediterraneibacter hominis]
MKARKFIGRILCVVFLAYTAAICVGPFLWVIFSSFKSNKEILDSAFSLPSSYSFDGYLRALEMSPIFEFFGNSVFIAAVNTVISIGAVSMAAYALARYEFRGKKIFTSLLSSSLLIPISGLLMPLYLIMARINLLDTKMGLIIVYAALGLPTSLFILRSTFLNIPKEVDEAAAIDGAGPIYTFTRIIIPMSRSGLATAATLHFLTSWNEFMFALVLTKSETNRTLPLALNYFSSQFSFDYTAMFAAITLSVLPSIIVFILLQEQITSSMAAGSVKG